MTRAMRWDGDEVSIMLGDETGFRVVWIVKETGGSERKVKTRDVGMKVW